MARDVDLFALLAASVDMHVDPEIPHHVVVPRADLAAFRRFETPRRTIYAQEDILPVQLWKLPGFLRHLALIRPGLRRPIYLTLRGQAVRGWMLQQLLKIEMACRSNATAIMHVDSDVGFFRSLRSEDAFRNGKVRYFRALGKTSNPMHRPWIDGACRFLGVPAPDPHEAHYVENCVLWSTAVTRAMVARIEEVHEAPFHEVLFRAKTLSEYYLYGLFADLRGGDADLAVEDISFCNSYWPKAETDTVDFTALRTRLQPKHCAVAIQSTHPIDLTTRARVYARARDELAFA